MATKGNPEFWSEFERVYNKSSVSDAKGDVSGLNGLEDSKGIDQVAVASYLLALDAARFSKRWAFVLGDDQEASEEYDRCATNLLKSNNSKGNQIITNNAELVQSLDAKAKAEIWRRAILCTMFEHSVKTSVRYASAHLVVKAGLGESDTKCHVISSNSLDDPLNLFQASLGYFDIFDSENMPNTYELHRLGYSKSKLVIPRVFHRVDNRFAKILLGLQPLENQTACKFPRWLIIDNICAFTCDHEKEHIDSVQDEVGDLKDVISAAISVVEQRNLPALLVSYSASLAQACVASGFTVAESFSLAESGLELKILYFYPKKL